jgi:DNA polymerase-1
MSKILLLDGNSLLYRGFFAMRMLTTSDNVPTNAIYSMALMLLSALESQKPDGVVCAFDAPVATFRHEAYDEYKGTRQRMPDELAQQRPLSRDLMRAFNIPILEIPGFEADDTIGTLAKKAQSESHSVMIVTGDLDALQLVDDRGPIQVMTKR